LKLIYAKQEEFEKAEDILKKAFSINPTTGFFNEIKLFHRQSIQHHCKLAFDCAKVDDLAGFKEHFDKALYNVQQWFEMNPIIDDFASKCPWFFNLFSNLMDACILSMKGCNDVEQAKIHLDKAIKLANMFVEAHQCIEPRDNKKYNWFVHLYSKLIQF